MISNLDKLARKIIENNQYLTLSTVDDNSNPWISPVVYTYDEDWNFYYVSMPSSKHSKNIKAHGGVSFAIFDSHQLWGEGVGLQIEATSEIVKLKDIPKVAKLYAMRKYPYGGINTKIAMNFIKSVVLQNKTYKIYKLIPQTIWMNDPNSKIDVRTKINFSMLE